jgi:hypothetical protein
MFSRFGLLSASWLAAACLCLLASAPAGAAVTGSSIAVTAPAGTSYLLDNQVVANGESVTVGGTTTGGNAGDKVDINCYAGAGSRPLVANVPVAADHSFSVTASLAAIAQETCVLRAVPAGDKTDYPPGSSPPYTGPVLNIGQILNHAVASGPNAGKLEYYFLWVSQPSGAFDYNSLGGCSVGQSYSYDPVTLGRALDAASNSLDYCNAWFNWENGGLGSTVSPTRSELQVDGVDAYLAGNAWMLTKTAGNLPGYPSLTYSYKVDPDTGDLALDETDQVVRCSPGGLFPPDPAHCSSFVPTGVQVTMHIVQNQSGRVATVVQRFASVDGGSHSVDLLEDNDFFHRNGDGELNFPWTGAGMTPYSTVGQVLPGPSAAGPGSFFVKGSASTPDGSEATPQGAVTFSNPPTSETIVATTTNSNHLSWVELHYALTIPAGGSVPLGFTYANGYLASQVAADAGAAEAAFRPAISVSGPRSGLTTAQRTVTVSGAAADGTGLNGVTVNGRTVPVGAGGAWSTPVSLTPGVNTITAIATNVFGNTAQAQNTVVYVPAPAIGSVRQAHRRWREPVRGHPGPRRPGGRGRGGHHAAPIGTTFAYTLNEAAQVRFVFTEQVPGRRAGRSCVAQNRRNRHHARCLRTITVGSHVISAAAGLNRWAFRGVMAGGRRLAPGSYTVTIVATTPSTGVQSAPARLRFTVVR